MGTTPVRTHKSRAGAAVSTRAMRARTARKRAATARVKSLRRILRILRAHLPDFKARYPIKSLGVFGSYVRKDATPESDLDVLVEFDEDARLGLFKFVGLQNEFSDLLGITVDLIEKQALKPRILENIMKEVVYV